MSLINACPAIPYPSNLTQPNGNTFMAQGFGDEWTHYVETLEGYSIIQDSSNGYWTYALKENGTLIPSDYYVAKDNPNRLNLTKHLSPEKKYQNQIHNTPPLTGTAKIIAIRVNFTDVGINTISHNYTYFNNTLNGNNNSVKNYYNEVSYGQLNIITTIPNKIYTLPHTMAFYSNPELSAIISDAMNAADGDVNFSLYDSVMIIHAGAGQESSQVANDYWSGRWPALYLTYDGKTFESGVVVPEYQANPYGILGVYCHEFAHEYGAPDLYDYDSDSSKQYPVGKWDLMDYGMWNNNANKPAHISSYLKYDLDANPSNGINGWLNITTITSNQIIPITQLESLTGNKSYRINIPNSNQFFIIENRQQTGYDSYLPEAGIIIWHIDENMPDGVGHLNDGPPQNTYFRAWVEDPYDPAHINSFRDYAAYWSSKPFVQGNNFFNSTSSPSSNSNEGIKNNISVASISARASIMNATINLTSCTCTGWTAGSCGGGSCASPNRQYNRTCNPSGCNIQTNCTYDSSCSTEGGSKEITVCASGCNYTTIQNAIIHSNAVDLVSITDGRVYNEQLRMNFTTASRIACLSNSTIKGSGSGIGINITGKDAFSILGCKIDGFSYGIRILNTDNGKMEDTIISNNAYGIFIENQSHNGELTNITVTGSVNKGIRMETEISGRITHIYIQDSNISNNGYVGIFDSMGNDNHYLNNNISGHSNYGIHIYTNGLNENDYISNNKLFNNGKGLYLEVSNTNHIYSNLFCPSNTNQDIDIGDSTNLDGDENTCEKPGGWNDAGTTGCTYYCDPGASVTLLFPPNNYEDTDGNISLICESDDNYQLVNVSLYHDISGIWQINQTIAISGTSNITTFNINNLVNGTNFAWNCLAYDNNSRGGFALANWSVSIIIDNIPPNVNIASPLNQTYNVSSISFNATISEEGFCEYSLDNGVTNNSMSTIDNRNFSATNSMSNGNYFVKFYCIDALGNMNNTEGVSFNVNAPIPPNDTHKFYIKNSTGNPVAWFGSFGNIVLKGSCIFGGTCTAPSNSFIIANNTDNTTAYIDNSGNLCIEKGDCSDESATCNPARNAFIMRNSSNYNMSYIDFDGDLCLTGQLYENSIYV